MLRLTLAILHLLALGIGLGAVWARARNLSGTLDRTSVDRALAADSWWGVSAVVWIATGLWRVLAGVEKPTAYYLDNSLFYLKMSLLGLILLLELWPMMTLIRWRIALARRGAIELIVRRAPARRVALLSYIESAIIIAMVAIAVMMARGYGMRAGA